MSAGADPSAVNSAGHDAVYEAEINGKEEVVGWLLKEGWGLERGVGGVAEDGKEGGEGVDEDEEGNGVEEVGERMEGLGGLEAKMEENLIVG